MLPHIGTAVLLLIICCSTSAEEDCLSNKDCPSNRLCTEFKCRDPCLLNVCGNPHNCKVSNHITICACMPGFSGPLSKGESPSTSSKTSKGEKKFVVFQDWMTWHGANVHCIANGMRLATIENQEEQGKIANELRKNGGDGWKSWWIGGSDLAKTGYLWYSSGKHMTFRNFGEYQPDNHNHTERGVEHCLEIRENLDFRWNDILCDDKLRFVCETFEPGSNQIDVRKEN